MAVLTIWQGDDCRRISFSGTPLLSELLDHQDHPCGGRGSCKKCALRAEGCLSPPTDWERAANSRLSCQTRLLGDAQVWLPDPQAHEIELAGSAPAPGAGIGQYGAAVDVGTTTLALKLYHLQTGQLLAANGMLNPQRSVAADVMGRIGAAMAGSLRRQQELVKEVLWEMLTRACAGAGITTGQIDRLVVTGNTAMLYILTGRDPSCLSGAPFRADCLFGFGETLWDIPVYYPSCVSGFVGADITCALLDSGLCSGAEAGLLCDIGTNGELALWHDGRLYVTSTAAGPAFEGAGISCGCGSIPGAIDRVWMEDGALRIHTIGGGKAVGLCGSGLVDAIAALLAAGEIDETGAVEWAALELAPGVTLIPADIRAVQLAKAAIAAGIRTLLELAGISEAAVARVFLAGGFGAHLDIRSAAAIGLIPDAWRETVTVLGNAALSGAARLLLDQRLQPQADKLASGAVPVELGGNSRFGQHFMEQMLFGEASLFDGDSW